MAETINKLDAVRQAVQELGTASPQELAAHIESRHGVKIQPVIVTVLLGSLEEQQHLARVRQLAKEIAEQVQKEAARQGKKGGRRRKPERSESPVAEGVPAGVPGLVTGLAVQTNPQCDEPPAATP